MDTHEMKPKLKAELGVAWHFMPGEVQLVGCGYFCPGGARDAVCVGLAIHCEVPHVRGNEKWNSLPGGTNSPLSIAIPKPFGTPLQLFSHARVQLSSLNNEMRAHKRLIKYTN